MSTQPHPFPTHPIHRPSSLHPNLPLPAFPLNSLPFLPSLPFPSLPFLSRYHQEALGFSDALRYSGKEDVVHTQKPHEMVRVAALLPLASPTLAYHLLLPLL